MNYYKVSHYENGDLNNELVIYEYVPSTTMDFIASLLVVSRIWFERKEVAEVDAGGADTGKGMTWLRLGFIGIYYYFVGVHEHLSP